MKKKCFSCQENASNQLINSLLLHQYINQKEGISFWFYKQNKNAKVQISDDDSFKILLPSFEKNEGAEWAHITEFRGVANEKVYTNNANSKLKTIKQKSK